MKRSVVSVILLAAAFTGIGCAGELDGDQGEDRAAVFAPKKSMRIAVVGAGPSGLTAAHELQALGYTNITVFEREDHVGGKVRTIKVGGQNVEMGAVFASPDYPLTLSYATQYGVATATSNTPRFIFETDTAGVQHKYTPTQFLLAHFTPTEIGQATAAYAEVLRVHGQKILAAKMNDLPPDLELNFSDFIAKGVVMNPNRPEGEAPIVFSMKPISELGRALINGFGYGFYEDTAAIYNLKILFMLIKPSPTGPASSPFFSFPGGFQTLWQKVAEDLDVKDTNPKHQVVRLNTKVINVLRFPATGTQLVTTYNPVTKILESRVYDAVIISAPLPALVLPESFMILDPAETKHFKKVVSTRYVVSLFTAPGVEGGQGVFVQDTAFPDEINRVGVWANPSAASPVFQAYQITEKDPDLTLDDIFAQLTVDMQELAGATGPIALLPAAFTTTPRIEWPDYFPRVSAADMAAGFYDKFESEFQGKGNVFYVGGTLSFETVETSARYAKTMVTERFGAPVP